MDEKILRKLEKQGYIMRIAISTTCASMVDYVAAVEQMDAFEIAEAAVLEYMITHYPEALEA